VSQALPAILLYGPTASGKTALSIALAQQLPIEVISVDSALVYRGMDIGTAKPTLEERAGVPHHLIDIRDPAEPYSAANFSEDALSLVEAIRGRGHVPVLVGGTMLYFKALTEGLSALPSADPELRVRIQSEAEAAGWPALHARLAERDPETAARLHPNDGHRILRALEIVDLTGRPASESLIPSAVPVLQGPRLTYLLQPPERAELHRRIECRFHQMMAQGLLDEVAALYRRGDLSVDMPSIRAVGYRQMWGHLAGEYPLEEAVQRAIAATRQFAKRQLTWLRGMSGQKSLRSGDPDALTQICGDVQQANRSDSRQ